MLTNEYDSRLILAKEKEFQMQTDYFIDTSFH